MKKLRNTTQTNSTKYLQYTSQTQWMLHGCTQTYTQDFIQQGIWL